MSTGIGPGHGAADIGLVTVAAGTVLVAADIGLEECRGRWAAAGTLAGHL